MSMGDDGHQTTNTTTSLDSGCFIAPPWYSKDNLKLWDFPFLLMQLQFVVVFAVTQSLHRLFFKHLGLPPLVSQLMAGILLSPTVFIARIPVIQRVHEVIFPEISDQVWQTMATLGASLTLFVVAVKMDFTIVRRTGRKPITIGLLILSLPSIMNSFVAALYGHFSHLNKDQAHMLDLKSCATLLSLTPFPVIVILLDDLKLLNSELGRLALSVAIISELGSISMMVLSKIASGGDSLSNSFFIIILVVLAIFIFRPLMNSIVKHTPKGKYVKNDHVLLAIMIMLVGAVFSDISGNFAMLGCFIVGAAIPEGPPLGSTIVLKFETFVLGLLQPFFISTAAMRADVFKINFHDKLIYGEVMVTLSSFLTKITICLACGVYYNLSMYDALALAAILCSKGIVDICSYNMYSQSKLIQDSTYTYLIIVVTLVAIIAPVAIKGLYHPLRKYAGYQKRDIMHCPHDTPMRILTCICRPDNVSGITTLLSLSSITTQNPMIVDVLHLIKLSGRSQPIFISHDLQQRKATSNIASYSDDVIWVLNRFQMANMSGLRMHLFTLVTPPSAMHEDICTLALDKLSSLIIMPFHRKISINGTIEFEDHAQRLLNSSILQRSPCSVGIFVDKGNSRMHQAAAAAGSDCLTSVQVQGNNEENVILVAVLFIGGSDDREAVAYAKRMAKGARVKVLVIRIMALGDSSGLTLLDLSAISLIQEYSNCNPQFKYTEKVVKEGAETARLLKSLVPDFDLVIVGRRYEMECPQTSDLKQWVEVPELGIIGDLLASPDFKCKTSILVIQQQKLWSTSKD